VYTGLRRKSEDWLARNQDKVLEWSNMHTHELGKKVTIMKLRFTQ